ncbi:unnamed protein product [Leptosia nina]|uniref:Uncharacterized protein n=1 Tax=Leptosia nina TaxID=320188 RepID=A0AAV1IXK8_9NEOP
MRFRESATEFSLKGREKESARREDEGGRNMQNGRVAPPLSGPPAPRRRSRPKTKTDNETQKPSSKTWIADGTIRRGERSRSKTKGALQLHRLLISLRCPRPHLLYAPALMNSDTAPLLTGRTSDSA